MSRKFPAPDFDPDYIIQEIMGDRVVNSYGYDSEDTARWVALDVVRSPYTECDTIRIITRDSELVVEHTIG